jgi:putative spermidine/putrescine transport system ATP-binding protein
MTRTGLALVGASIPFGDKTGLEHVSLEVSRGETLALLGPSGVGKTSILRALAGLAPVSSGAILVDGRDVTSVRAEHRGVVYMHQSPSLFPHLTVLDNVTFPMDVRGVAKPAARERALALLDRVQMRFAATRAPATLSGGQRHRVALARALAAEPAVLLLDEPFASLDPELRADVRTAVVEILARGRGPAVVLVTHDVDEAAGIADRVAILLNGRIVQVGSPAELLAAPHSVAIARFLGLANLIPGIRNDGIVSSDIATFERSGPSGAVSIVARAGALRVRAGVTGSSPGTVRRVLNRVGGIAIECDVGDRQIIVVPEPGFQPTPGASVEFVVDAASLHVIEEPLKPT